MHFQACWATSCGNSQLGAGNRMDIREFDAFCPCLQCATWPHFGVLCSTACHIFNCCCISPSTRASDTASPCCSVHVASDVPCSPAIRCAPLPMLLCTDCFGAEGGDSAHSHYGTNVVVDTVLEQHAGFIGVNIGALSFMNLTLVPSALSMVGNVAFICWIGSGLPTQGMNPFAVCSARWHLHSVCRQATCRGMMHGWHMDEPRRMCGFPCTHSCPCHQA